ncbi:sensor histidine kinase [Jatrophihabitans fulvus]
MTIPIDRDERLTVLDSERRRIALELHDGVAQDVLSAGFALSACCAEAVERGDTATARRLADVRDLLAHANDEIRSTIIELHRRESTRVAVTRADDLPARLRELIAQHPGAPAVRLDLAGRADAHPLPADVVHALARVSGEALANVRRHAKADEAVVRLSVRPTALTLSVGDDGVGDPAELRRLLRLERDGVADGGHCGLAGMAARAASVGARLSIRRARLGGVCVEVRLPLSVPEEQR